MTATTLDVGLCLLLVSAAALTVVGARDPVPPSGRADAAAATVSVTTANVTYTLAPAARDADASVTTGGELDRVAHGTLAELVAQAAVRNVTVEGAPLTNASAAFGHGVGEAVLDALPRRTRVDARWTPYPGAHLQGRTSVGPQPPRDRPVDAARLTVPVHAPTVTSTGTAGGSGDEGSPADRLAGRIVRVLFPPDRLRFALHDDAPLPALVEHRYRRAGARYDADTVDALGAGGPTAANERLRPAVAERIRADLRDRQDGSGRAEPVDHTDRVVIVVRTWSP